MNTEGGSQNGAIDILIVDDHKAFRLGLKGLLLSEPNFKVIGEAGDQDQAIELAGKLSPDIVIMDINLGEANGIDVTAQILLKNPEIKVVGLSMHDEESIIEDMYQAGAVAYLTKNMPPVKLIDTIKELTL